MLSATNKELRDMTNTRLNTPNKNQKELMSQTTPVREKSKIRNFFSGFRSKKKDETAPQVEIVSSKPQAGTKSVSSKKGSSRVANRKNITDGRVDIVVEENDIIKEDYDVEYRENIHELLEQPPIRNQSVLENRKTGKFHKVYSRAVKSIVTASDRQIAISGDRIETELMQLANELSFILQKFFLFIQGLLTGLCLMHLFFILLNDDSKSSMSNYSKLGVRLGQLFYLIAFFAVIGSLHELLTSSKTYKDSTRIQSPTVSMDRKAYYLNATSFFCFAITYGIIIYNSEFVSVLSDNKGIVLTKFYLFEAGSDRWKILNIVLTIFSVLGWFLLVNGQRSSNPYYSISDADDMTDTESVIGD